MQPTPVPGGASSLLLLLLLLLAAAARAAPEGGGLEACPAPSPAQALVPPGACALLREDAARQQPNHPFLAPALVSELNETLLNSVLESLRAGGSNESGNGSSGGSGGLGGRFLAVLYHAEWCPFSRQLLPLYRQLAARFPGIFHVAVEEASLRPSVLSRFGVHSFPQLYVHSGGERFRYHGQRTLPALSAFYANVTGLGKGTRTGPGGSGGELQPPADAPRRGEQCPYPWAFHPEQWLREEACLTLATAFVLLRGACFLGPRLHRLLAGRGAAAVVVRGP